VKTVRLIMTSSQPSAAEWKKISKKRNKKQVERVKEEEEEEEPAPEKQQQQKTSQGYTRLVYKQILKSKVPLEDKIEMLMSWGGGGGSD
jgi:hypothetical protein